MPYIVLIEVILPAVEKQIKQGRLVVSLEKADEQDAPSKELAKLVINMKNINLKRSFRLRFDVPVSENVLFDEIEVSVSLLVHEGLKAVRGDLVTAVASPVNAAGWAVVRLVEVP